MRWRIPARRSFCFMGSSFPNENKKALRPTALGRKASLPRYHPHSHHVRTLLPVTAESRPCLQGCSQANKGHFPGGLAAGDPPSLGEANSLFSRSTRFAKIILYHIPSENARGNGKFLTAAGENHPPEGAPGDGAHFFSSSSVKWTWLKMCSSQKQWYPAQREQ